MVNFSFSCYNFWIMLLTVDVGNTDTVLGLFKGRRLIKEYRFSTRSMRFPKLHKISAVIVASVVPAVKTLLKKELFKKTGCRPIFITANMLPGVKIRLKNKAEMGADRIINALAAFTLYKGPCVVVDFGTATTFDVVSAKGEHCGGVIAPGIKLARDTLHQRTAKLPLIEIKAPTRVIGKSTVEAMRSGLVFGYVAMVEGMVARIKAEMKLPPGRIKVIATGGLAGLICKYTNVVDRIDSKLTLQGLRLAAERLGLK
jgi:type III pantothenate kinase